MDVVNSLFEFGLSFFLFMNVKQVWKDKMVRGIYPPMVAFTFSWGLWNLFYYPHLGQWWSFVGGISVVLLNLVWLILIMHYRKN